MHVSHRSLLAVSMLFFVPAVACARATQDTNNHHMLPLISLQPGNAGDGVRVHDVYTRFYVRPARHQGGTGNNGGVGDGDAAESLPATRHYNDERRSLIRRALMASELSRVLSVKLQLRNPDIVANATLVAASYKSDLKQGESWSTEVNGAQYVTPYLRVDNNSLLRLEATLHASSKSSDQISRSMMSFVAGAAGMIAPVGSLVSSLNSDRINRAAEFSESAISGLMNDDLSERVAHEVPNAAWYCGPLARVSGRFPQHRSITSKEATRVGTWEVMADMPVISVFNPVPYPMPSCTPSAASSTTADSSARENGASNKSPVQTAAENAVSQLLPSDVLHFRLGENTDVYKELVSDPAIAPALSDFNRLGLSTSAGAKEQEKQLAYNLCSLIARKANALGFNRVDAAAIYWAYSFSPNLSKLHGELLRGNSCGMAVMMRSIFNLNVESNGKRSSAPAATDTVNLIHVVNDTPAGISDEAAKAEGAGGQ